MAHSKLQEGATIDLNEVKDGTRIYVNGKAGGTLTLLRLILWDLSELGKYLLNRYRQYCFSLKRLLTPT